MVEMKSGEVVLSLAAQLASWRAALVLVCKWATCKPWQRRDFHQHSIFLADCLQQSKQTVWESSAALATEFRKTGKRRRKRRPFADVDGPGANPEPELGPRGPTLKKQVPMEYKPLDMLPILQPGVWDVARATSADFDMNGVLKKYNELDLLPILQPRVRDVPMRPPCANFNINDGGQGRAFPVAYISNHPSLDFSEAMDPTGSPSPIRKVADTAHPSTSSSPAALPVPGWWSFSCFGNGK